MCRTHLTKRLPLILVFLFCFVACTSPKSALRKEGVVIRENLVFAERSGKKLTLDFYENSQSKNPPLVIWFHGGGYVAGSKEDCPLGFLVNKGFAVASVSYRYTTVAPWPAQRDDALLALNWLRETKDLNFDRDNIYLAGISAGGHLASITGLADQNKPRVRGIIDLCGGVDMRKLHIEGSPFARDCVEKMFNGPPRNPDSNVDSANPALLVNSHSPPFLIIHGTADKTIPINQSEILVEKLKTSGMPVTFIRLEGMEHSLGGPNNPVLKEAVIGFLIPQKKRQVK